MELNELREQMRDEGNKLQDEIAALKAQLTDDEHLVAAYKSQTVEFGKAKAEIERLRMELLRIGDMAVVDWDDATAMAVDEAVPLAEVPKTYAEIRRAEIARFKAMQDEIAALKAQLAGYEHLAAAYGLQAKELEKVKQDAEYWQQEAGREDKAMTTERLAALMAHLQIIDWNALNDAKKYDGGFLLARIAELNAELQRGGLRKD